MSESIFSLNNIDILDEIPDQEIMRLCDRVRDETYETPYILYIPNNLLEHIYIVKNGEVQLYHMHNGKRTVFDTLGVGDIFGNFSTETIRATHFAEAGRNTRVCLFPVEQFLRLVAEHPELMLKMMQVMAKRLTDYENRISLCPAPAKVKVLQELKRYRDKKTKSRFGREEKGIRLTHEKIASLTGLNRVTVTRALHELEQEEKILFHEKTGAIQVQ